MGQKGIGTLIIVGIIFIVSAIAIAGIGVYFVTKGEAPTGGEGAPTGGLITKNPSEMTLTLGDLSSRYRLDFEQFINGPTNAAEQLTPNSVTTWQSWGFEVSCHRDFKSDVLIYTIDIWNFVDRYSSSAGAKSSYEYRYSVLSNRLTSMTETIGDQSFAIYTPAGILPETYGVYFRKNNVFAGIVVERLDLADAVLYAHIVESRIS